jgi:hypothetical protein
MIRIWIEKETLKNHTNEDGDLVMGVPYTYFFKRSEISNEHGFHLEFNNDKGDGFELYIPYEDFKTFYSLMSKRLVDYAETKNID